jgi:predicted metal-dependent hydrolase
MQDFIDYGNLKINFHLKRSKRKSLGISVLPSGEVEVTAPEMARIEKIKEILSKRASWIVDQQREVSKYDVAQPERQIISGETVKYLGRQYRLKVNESSKNEVLIIHDWIHINVKSGSDKKKIYKDWLKSRALQDFQKRLCLCMEKASRIGLTSIPELKIRKMSKRWGSCTHDGVITLNIELVSAPVDCIDYVILHELCHLKEASHNQRFKNLMSLMLPEWRELKFKLETQSVI